MPILKLLRFKLGDSKQQGRHSRIGLADFSLRGSYSICLKLCIQEQYLTSRGFLSSRSWNGVVVKTEASCKHSGAEAAMHHHP